MGITQFSLDKLTEHKLIEPGQKVLELGCQNTYFKNRYNLVAKPYFEKLGQNIDSIDLCGCNDAEKIDLDLPLPERFINQYDVVTNFGTSEHCGDLYQVFKNIYSALKVGGLSINENPKTGSWIKHGYFYMTEEFYTEFCNKMGLELIDLGEHPAMGNITDGWNIYAVFKKVDERKFMTKTAFNKLNFLSE